MERRESPELSLEDFQKTTDTEDFGSSLLSSLDFNLDKYDGTKKDVAEPLLNKDLPSPKLQVEKKFSTASFRKNSPTISSPLSTPPEISSTRSENEMNNAHTILDSFPSLSRELGSISGKTPKSALKGQKNSLSNSSDGTAVQEVYYFIYSRN